MSEGTQTAAQLTAQQMLRLLADEMDAGTVLCETIGIERRNFCKDLADATADRTPQQFVAQSQIVGYTYTIQTRIMRPMPEVIFFLPEEGTNGD